MTGIEPDVGVKPTTLRFQNLFLFLRVSPYQLSQPGVVYVDVVCCCGTIGSQLDVPVLRRGCLLGDFTAKLFGCDDVANNLRICKFLKETLNFGTCFQKSTSIRNVVTPPPGTVKRGGRKGRTLAFTTKDAYRHRHWNCFVR